MAFFSVIWAFPTVFISMLEEEDFLKSWPSRVSHTRGPQPLKKNARMSTTHVPIPCLQIVKDSFFSAMLTGLLLLGLGFAENAKKHVIINYVFSFSLSRAAMHIDQLFCFENYEQNYFEFSFSSFWNEDWKTFQISKWK